MLFYVNLNGWMKFMIPFNLVFFVVLYHDIIGFWYNNFIINSVIWNLDDSNVFEVY